MVIGRLRPQLEELGSGDVPPERLLHIREWGETMLSLTILAKKFKVSGRACWPRHPTASPSTQEARGGRPLATTATHPCARPPALLPWSQDLFAQFCGSHDQQLAMRAGWLTFLVVKGQLLPGFPDLVRWVCGGGGGSGRGWRRGAAATRHALRPHRAATGAQIAVPRNAHPHTAPLPPRFMLQLPAAAGVHHQPAGSCPAAAGRLRQHPAPPAPCGRGRSGHRQHPGGSGGCAEDGRAGHKGGAGRHALSWRLRMWQPRRGGHTLQRRAARGSVQEAPSSAHTRPQHAPSRPSSTPSSAHTRPPPLAATPARRR